MRVYAALNPDNPHPLARVWVKSWRESGWTPKILMPGESPRSRTRRGKFRVSDFSEINRGLKPGDRKTRLNVRIFPPGATEDDVYNAP